MYTIVGGKQDKLKTWYSILFPSATFISGRYKSTGRKKTGVVVRLCMFY